MSSNYQVYHVSLLQIVLNNWPTVKNNISTEVSDIWMRQHILISIPSLYCLFFLAKPFHIRIQVYYKYQIFQIHPITIRTKWHGPLPRNPHRIRIEKGGLPRSESIWSELHIFFSKGFQFISHAVSKSRNPFVNSRKFSMLPEKSSP